MSGINHRDTSTLCLYFPQWQGSGPSPEILDGAQSLKRAFATFSLEAIALATVHDPPIRNDVWGYDAILSQLMEARAVVTRHQPRKMLTLGGDCGVELVPISYLNARYGSDLAVVWLDAHGDLNTPQSSSTKLFHGMSLRHLLGEGDTQLVAQCFSCVTPDQIRLVGCRDLDEPERSFVDASEIFRSDDTDELLEALSRHGRLYIHIDLDVLDPNDFAHVKCPTPGGFSRRALASLLRSLDRHCDVVGLSILECTATEGTDMSVLDDLGIPQLLGGR